MLQKETISYYQSINKKAYSGLVRKFTIKKLEFTLRAVFLRKLFLFIIVFFSHLEICRYHIEFPLMTKFIYSQMIPNEKTIAHVFLSSTLIFRKF